MTIKRIVFAAFLALELLLSSCSDGGGRSTPTPVPSPVTIQKPTYQVQRGTVEKVLRFQGRVSPVDQADLFFRTDGYVKTLNFSLGDQVQAGDVLAQLEMGDLEIQLFQAQLALQQAETKLAQAEQENANQLIDAQIALDKANLQAKRAGAIGLDPSAKAQKDYDKNLEDVQQGLQAAMQEYNESVGKPDLTTEERDAVRQKLQQAKEVYVNTWLKYAEIVGGPGCRSASCLTMAKDLALARLRVEELKAGVDPMIYLDVEQRRLDLQTIQEKVGQASLIAPFDGEILSLNLTPGSQISAFQPLLTVADPSQLEIIAYPSSNDLALMSIGQAVTVEWTSRAGENNPGNIRLVPVATNTTTSNDQDQDQAVHIQLDDAKISLNLGEAATIVIQVGKRENVLWLPPSALRTFQGQDFVLVEENGVQRRKDVSLGLRGDDRVEILSGLTEGQTVVGP